MALATRLAHHLLGRRRPHVVPDRPALAVRERPRLRRARARARAGPHRGRRRRRDDGRLLGRERLALPQPPLDAPDLAAVPRATTGATGCSTPASCGSTTRAAGPATHAVSAALFATYPLLAVARLARRAAARDRGALPARRARQGPLRVVLPARRRPGAPARRLDPPHDPPAPRASRRPARSGARYFDAEAGRARTRSRQTLPGPRGRRTGSRSATARSGPTARAAGPRPQGRAAAWELAMRGDAEPLRHLPREWMYRAPLPRTKLESPLPSARLRRHDRGRRARAASSVDGWPGMVGHNWGAEHAATWIWLHGVALRRTSRARGWTSSVGRVRVGPVLTPWIANGALHARRRAGTGSAARGPRASTRRPRAAASSSPGAVVEARSPRRPDRRLALRRPRRRRAPLAQLLDRRGHGRGCGDRELRTAARRRLRARHGAAARHGVALQPFPDGLAAAPRARGPRPPRCWRGGTRSASARRGPAHRTRAAASRSAASSGRSSETIAESPGAMPEAGAEARRQRGVVRVDALDADLARAARAPAPARPSSCHAGETSSASRVARRAAAARRRGCHRRIRRVPAGQVRQQPLARLRARVEERRPARREQPLVARAHHVVEARRRRAAASRRPAWRRRACGRRGGRPRRRSRRGRRAGRREDCTALTATRSVPPSTASASRSSATSRTRTPRASWASSGNSSEVKSSARARAPACRARSAAATSRRTATPAGRSRRRPRRRRAGAPSSPASARPTRPSRRSPCGRGATRRAAACTASHAGRGGSP